MHGNKTGIAECQKDFSHIWSSTAQGEEGLRVILSLEGETDFIGLMVCGYAV